MVIDTDGSAFITKAEFDSLKNNFQAQIDNYNSSIDSKIDGAIAAYLAGVAVAQTEDRKTYFYAPKITCLTESEKTWELGLPAWDIIVSGWSGGGETSASWTGNHYYTLFCNYIHWAVTTSPTDFRETMINNRDNGCAAFRGIQKTKQSFNWTRIEASPNSYNNAAGSGVLYPSTGQAKYQDGDSTLVDNAEDGTLSVTEGSWKVADGTFTVMTWTPLTIAASRTITDCIYSDIIVFPQNTSIHGFSNEIIQTMNYNAGVNSVASPLRSAEETFDVASSVVKYCDFRYWRENDKNNGPPMGSVELFTDQWKTTKYKIYRWPYIGVDSQIKYWYQLYNPNITINGAEITDVSKTNDYCLGKGLSSPSLKSGLPLCYCKDGEVITIPFDFEDHTKDYEVWVKMDAFNWNSAPGSGTDCLLPVETYTPGTRSGSIKIVNGEGTYSFLVRRDSLIYINWAQGTNNGGGTLKKISDCHVVMPS